MGANKWPKTLGACVDRLYTMRQQRLVKQAEAEKMKSYEVALQDHVLNNFKKDEVEGAKGKLASASISRTTVANVTDWEAFYKYIKKNEAWDMLQRRVNDAAYRARLDDKVAVPGVEAFGIIKLSITKAGK